METSRVLLGLAVAVLAPFDVPSIADKRIACFLATAAYGLYALIGVAPSGKAAALLALALAWSALQCRLRIPSRTPSGRPLPATIAAAARNAWSRLTSRPGLCALAAVASLLAAAFIFEPHQVLPDLHRFLDDDQAAVAVSGLLLAVVAGHTPVALASAALGGATLVTPYRGVRGVDRLGLFLGWFERALIFVFIVSGQVSGAALALTAKSVARYPALERQEISGEYFLAGTFSSVLIAIAAGILTRLCLKMSAI